MLANQSGAIVLAEPPQRPRREPSPSGPGSGHSAPLMSDAPVYANDEHSAPDSAFASGELRHLAVGNRGRLLDARRTPITVVDVAPERGSFVVRVEAFEDAGARWELGLEEINRFQFARTATPATNAALAELRASAARFDRDLSIECGEAAREDSLRRLQQHRRDAATWLAERTSGLKIDVAKSNTYESR